MKKLFPCWIIFFLVACNTLSPQVLPSPTSVPPTVMLPPIRTGAPTSAPVDTPTSSPTFAPTSASSPEITPTSPETSFRFSLPHMVDEQNGWLWADKPDGTRSLLRTTDGGQTWATVPLPDPSAYEAYLLDAQTAWVRFDDLQSSTSILARTRDGGATWIRLSPPFSLYNAVFTFVTASDGWAETYGVGAGQAYIDVYETHDGGDTWSPILPTDPSGEPSDPGGTLHLCNICGDRFYYDLKRVVIAYGDLASEPGGSLRLAISTDQGQNWKKLTLPLPDARFADGLVDPQSAVFFGEQDGFLPVRLVKYNPDGSPAYNVLAVYVTHDGGQSWAASPGIIENVASSPLVDFVSPQDAFVACGVDLCVTHDGANTWQALSSNLVFAYTEAGEYVEQFDFVDASTGWALTSHDDQTTLWKTTQGGQGAGEMRFEVVSPQLLTPATHLGRDLSLHQPLWVQPRIGYDPDLLGK